ncbi:MAG TPA: hypothetical protein PLD25_30370 [Chloroflexota bacterium]|nr:hypothetical protein [Chloroflexota bacterium]HUM67996.1 hypothetical protein [Chloroflexota bacterium]
MKKLIMTSGERFDIETIKPKIEEIVNAFDRYLDDYPVKTSRSMHSLMGPVPMILDGARVRKESAATLVGRAIRAHEMNPRASGYLPPAALTALETATAELLELCQTVPVTAVTKVTERIRYSVYYARRKKGIERLEQTRLEFINFLQKKYVDDMALANAWNESDLSFEKVYYPSKKNEAYKKANTAKKADIDAFHDLPNAERLISDEEDEDNE